MHHRELEALYYDPLCAPQLIHQSKMEEVRISPSHHPLHVLPYVDPIQTHVHASPYFTVC